MDEASWADADIVPNKADHETNDGTITGGSWQEGTDYGFVKLPQLAFKAINPNGDSIAFDNDTDNNIDFNEAGVGDEGPVFARATVRFTTADLQGFISGSDKYYNNILGVCRSDSGLDEYVGWSLCIKYMASSNYVYFCLVTSKGENNEEHEYNFITNNEINLDSLGALTLNIALSIDDFNDGGTTTARLFVQGTSGS